MGIGWVEASWDDGRRRWPFAVVALTSPRGVRHRRWEEQAFGARLVAVCDRGVDVIAVSSSQVGAGVRRAPRRGRRGARRDDDVARNDLLS